MIFLETKNLYLRQLKETDIDIMYDYRNNEICSKYQRNQSKTRAKILKLIREHKNDKISLKNNYIFAIELKNINKMIGELVIMPVDTTITIGYTLSYKYHRRGYAYEILNSFVKLLHEKYPNCEFISFTEKENVASINLLKKLGYKYLGYSESKKSEVFGKWIQEKNLKI